MNTPPRDPPRGLTSSCAIVLAMFAGGPSACFQPPVDLPFADGGAQTDGEPTTTTAETTAGPADTGPNTATGSVPPIDDPSTGLADGTDTEVDSTTTTSATTATPDPDSTSGSGCPAEPACEGLVCGAPADQCPGSCGQCDPISTCIDDGAACGFEVGWPTDLGTTGTPPADTVFGHPVHVSIDGTLTGLGVLGGGQAGLARLSLYTDGGNGPGALVHATAAFAIAAGDNTVDVGGVPVAAGDYWLMVHLETVAPIRRSGSGQNQNTVAIAFHDFDTIPAVLDDAQITVDYQYNLFALLTES
ncbi:MAG: hypothetical protein K0V04_24280 [Deltaproteobacteria bacterium]|nr:hypothetical protein [Deltaproteobacteria bacterium]